MTRWCDMWAPRWFRGQLVWGVIIAGVALLVWLLTWVLHLDQNWNLLLSITLIILANIVTFWIAWKSQSDKLGEHRTWLLVSFVVSTLLTTNTFVQQFNTGNLAKARIANLEKTEQDLIEGNKSLLTKISLVQATCDTMRAEIKSGMRIVHARDTVHTTSPSVVVPARESELGEAKGSRTTVVDPKSGFTVTRFIFRAKNVTPLRDIQIDMYFKKVTISPVARIHGAIVVEQGTKQGMIDPWHYRYTTGYLSQSNDIIVDAIIDTNNKLDSLLVSP